MVQKSANPETFAVMARASGRGWGRGLLVLPLLWLLAACVAPSGPGVSGKPTTLSLLKGEILATAPRGYCADKASSHDNGNSAVILMGRCPGSAADPALISVAVGAPGSSAVLKSGAKALSDYFLSPPGRAALARDGRPGSVRVAKTLLSEGALVLRVEDRNAGAYWRAVLGLKGRLVSVSVMAPEGAVLSEAAGRQILDATIAAMQRANQGGTAAAAPAG